MSSSTAPLSKSTLEYLTEFHNKTGKIHVGVDLASRVVQVCYYSYAHKRIINKEIRTTELEKFLNEFKRGSLIVGFEACGSSHYWARRVRELDHEYRCFMGAHIKGRRGMSKTDKIDAMAIFKATIEIDSEEYSIECKSEVHQLLSSLMVTRASIVKQKVISINALRALAYEHGLIFPPDISHNKAVKYVQELYTNLCAKHGSESMICYLFNISAQAYIEQINGSLRIIESLDKDIKRISHQNETCQLLRTIPGVGYVVSLMLYIAGYNINNFKNAKHFAGFCGIAPHVEGSGGVSSTISMRHYGNRQLASLLYIGAMSHYSQKIKKLLENSNNEKLVALRNKRRKVIICAIANHIAKSAYAVIRDKKPYVSTKASGFITAFNESK